MIRTHAARNDFRDKIVLAFDRHASHAPQHAYLTDVRESVRDRTLEQLFGWNLGGIGGSEQVVEGIKRFEETNDLPVPREWWRIMPHLLAAYD